VRYEAYDRDGRRHKLMTLDHTDLLFATGGVMGTALVAVEAVKLGHADERWEAGRKTCKGCTQASADARDHICMNSWGVRVKKAA
jgi:hypothetical protein